MRLGGGPRARLLKAYAVVAPGLEEVAASELRALRLGGVEVHPGGVAFKADVPGLLRANRWLRSVSRVLAVVAASKLRTFEALIRFAEGVPWGDYLPPDRAVRVHVTSTRSRLYHEGAIADRFMAVLGRRSGAPDVHVFVRLLADRISVAVDTSGELLHRRGYRQAIGEAPLRETLAAGVLLAAGYDGTVPLIDPMCGSGTFAVEAALIAAGRAPGAGRRFALEDWPSFPSELAAELDPPGREHALVLGFDRDARVIEAARANAERAGAAVAFGVQEAATLPRPDGPPGLLVVNPPYGQRLPGGDAALHTMVALADRFHGWRTLILHPGSVPGFSPFLRLKNGGIPLGVLTNAALP